MTGGDAASPAPPATPSTREGNDPIVRRYAERVLAEQLTSQVNLSKLAAGKVTGFTIESQGVSGSRYAAQIRVSFNDGTSGPGEFRMGRYGGMWYFTGIFGKRTTTTGGEADSVSDPGGIADLGERADQALMTIFIEQAWANQDSARQMAGGGFTGATVTGIDRGLNTATLRLRMNVSGGGTQDASLGMLRKYRNWYVVRFSLT